MQRIRRQFGSKFAEMLAQCPSLVADLKEVRRRNIRIRRVKGECQAWSEPSSRVIYIGRSCSRVIQLLYLAHECEHMLRGQTPDPSPRRISRRRYVSMSLDEETSCIIRECEVVRELMDAGYKVDSDTMTWYRRWRRGGRKAVRRAVEKAVASGTADKYPRYYRQQYDEESA